jgi:hypothetical protein
MNQHPIVLLYPLFKWLNYAVAEYGLYLYMATVCLSPLLIAWILKGGFWRRPPGPLRLLMPPPLPKLRAPCHHRCQNRVHLRRMTVSLSPLELP